MRYFKAFVFVMSLLVVAGCDFLTGEEVLRVSVDEAADPTAPVFKSASYTFETLDELHFWTDVDLEYTGEIEMNYVVQIMREGELYEEVALDPFEKDLTINSREVTVNDKTEISFSGRNLIMNIPEKGEYTFNIYLFASPQSSLTINNFDFYIKM